MHYSKFNQYIKKRFFKNDDIGSHVVLSVDKQVIDDFCRENNTTEQDLRKEFQCLFSRDWSYALENENFFGLAAIQVYVAHQMGDDEKYSSDEYNPRFIEILKGDSKKTIDIEKLYRDYQIQLWTTLKKWCLKNGFFFEIPKDKKYKGRFIQYPLTQALLNQKDLSKLPLLFAENGIKPYNKIGFDEFQKIIKELDEIPRNIPTPHYAEIRNRLLKNQNGSLLELLYRQVFEYYCDWDGEIPELAQKQILKRLNVQELEKTTNYLVYEEHFFQVIDYKYALIERIDIDSIDLKQRIKKHYRLSNSDFIIFIKDEYGDWVETKYLERGTTNLIVIEKGDPIEYLLKQIDSKQEVQNYKYYSTLEITIPGDYQASGWLSKLLKEKSKPFIIENGLKLDRKVWMSQAGPTIIFEKIVKAWLISSHASSNIEEIKLTDNNLSFKLTAFLPGHYVLAVRDFGKIKFEIKEPSVNANECIKGWNISKKPALWEPNSEPFQICGLVNSFTTEQDSNSEIRDWINVNINRFGKTKSQYNNQVTNAINQANHGI